MKIFKRKILICGAVISSIFLLHGCGGTPIPLQPELPKTNWQTVEDIIKKDSREPVSQWVGTEGIISLNGKTVGINEFKGNETGAPLASQTITRELIKFQDLLKTNGDFKVVDRSTLVQRKNELQMVNESFSTLDEGQQLQMLGKALAADYFLDGIVVEKTSDQKTLHLKELIVPGELSRYEKDYKDYIVELDRMILEASNSPTALIDRQGTYLHVQNLQKMKAETKTPAQFAEEKRKSHTPETRNVASIGITARLIDVRTGEFVWLYQDEMRGFSVMDTMQQVSKKLTESMLKETTSDILH